MATGNRGYITEKDIRTFMQDDEQAKNLLLDDFEFTPEDIRSAQTFVIDKWNETPPPVGVYRYDSFPFRYHLLMAVAGHLLTSKALGYARNDLKYQIGGGSIDDKSKWDIYFKLGSHFTTTFNEWMRHKKVELNMEQGWGFDPKSLTSK